MTLNDIANMRLINQKLDSSNFSSAEEIVQWMGAIQSQDYAMSKWAMGIRLNKVTHKLVEKAIHDGTVIRTHVLRPTWHLVSAKDVYWMVDLTASKLKSLIKTRQLQLDLTKELISKCYSIIEKELSGNRHLTREELILLFNNAKILTNDNRASHIFLSAELDGIICSGSLKGQKQSYALLEERVPKGIAINREEALQKLAHIYFNSHGPATIKDFAWWSGLSLTDSRIGLESIKAELIKETIETNEYWFSKSVSLPNKLNPSVYLLPAFDEFIISYTDRSATIPTHHQKMAFTSNGIFKPIIVINGQVTGIWKRTIKKDKIILETQFIKEINKKYKSLLDKAALEYGHFFEKKIELIHQAV